MIDFTFTEPFWGVCVFCLLTFVLAVTTNIRAICYGNNPVPYNRGWNLYLFLCVFFCAITNFIDLDFYHYQGMVFQYSPKSNDNYGEEFYQLLIVFVNKNYLFFRLVVWGISLALIYKTFRKFDLDTYKTFYFFLCAFILVFSYARASLAFSVYFYGLSILFNNKKGLLTVVISIALILLSIVFHTSAYFLIAITPFCFVKIGKKLFVFLFLVSLILALNVDAIFELIMSNLYLINHEDITRKMTGYAAKTADSATFFGIIQSILQFGAYYVVFLSITYSLFLKKRNSIHDIPKAFIRLYSFIFIIMIIATLFLVLPLEDKVFFYRILFMSFIPLTIVVCWLEQKKLMSFKLYMFVLSYCLVAQLWRYLYSVYTLL